MTFLSSLARWPRPRYLEACGGDYDEVVARVQESSPGASSLSGDDLVWRVAEVWKRAMESR